MIIFVKELHGNIYKKILYASGAMSKWTCNTAELLDLKTTTNYNLMSPLKGSMKKKRKNLKQKLRNLNLEDLNLEDINLY